MKPTLHFFILSYNLLLVFASDNWRDWWTYDGVSGPEFWALNPKWSACSKGRKQSPVDIDTRRLLFDPGLKAIQLNGDLVEGNLENTGRGLRFNLKSNHTRKYVLHGGPLAYEYRLSHLILHFGRENDRGSEHTLNGIKFPGELQLYFYNHILYENHADAESQPNGLAVISVLIQLIDSGEEEAKRNSMRNEELGKLLETMDQIKYKGTAQISHQLNVNALLPKTQLFLTYEGSVSEPPCSETANWIVLNKPVYILEKSLFSLRNSIVIDGYGDNFRPIQALNNRCITTNIASNLNGNGATGNSATGNSATGNNANSVSAGTGEINTSNKRIKTEQKLDETINQLANQTSAQDELSGLKKFCTTNNVYGYYTYKANIKQDNLT